MLFDLKKIKQMEMFRKVLQKLHEIFEFIKKTKFYQKIYHQYFIISLLLVIILSSPLFFWPNKIKPNPDAWFYLTGSLNILKFGRYLDTSLIPIVNRGPVLSFLLSLPMSLFNNISTETASISIIIFNILGLTLIVYLGEKYFLKGSGFLALAMIISSSYFQEWLFLRVMTDLPQSFMIILGLSFTLIAIREKKWFLYILLGVIFGIGFLTKESTFLWLPFPIILWLLNTEKIRSHELFNNLLFLFCFFFTVFPWFNYVYKTTGEIYLLSRFNQQIRYFQDILKDLHWSSLVIVGIFIVGIFCVMIFYRKKIVFKYVEKVDAVLIRRTAYLLIIFYLAITFTPVSLKQLFEFLWEQLIPIFPIYLAILAWIYYYYQLKNEKNIIHKWVILIIIFSIPTFLIISKWNVQPRNLSLFMLINYILIANAGIGLLRIILKKIKLHEYSNELLILFLILFFIISLKSNISLSLKRNSLNPFWYPAMVSANWTENNVNKNSNILMTWWARDEYYFLTKGEFPLISVFKETAEEWNSIDLMNSSNQLFTRTDHLEGEFPILISLADPNPDRSNNFIVVYPSQLSLKVNENNANFFIVSGNHRLSPLGLSEYLNCHPDFELKFESIQSNGDGIKIYSNPEDLKSYQDCKTVINSETLKRIFEDARIRPGYHNDFQVLKLLGDNIYLYPQDDLENLESYLFVGELYSKNNEAQKALIAYRRAAELDSRKTFEKVKYLFKINSENIILRTVYADLLIRFNSYDESFRILNDIIDHNPKFALPHFVLGQILQKLGDFDQSLIQFKKAIELDSDEIDYSLFLSQIYMARKDYSNANNLLKILSTDFPESAVIKKETMQSQANYLASNGVTKSAARLYNQINNNFINSTDLPSEFLVLQDLSSMIIAKNDVDEKSKVYRDVFFQTPAREVIYMHPTSSIAFNTIVPNNARLKFSIALSSSVWYRNKGDGVQFNLYLVSPRTKILIWSKYLNPKAKLIDRSWLDADINLHNWANQKISLIFETKPGPDGNTDFDWAGWGEPRIVVPTQFSFLESENFSNSVKSQIDENLIRKDEMTIDYESRRVIFVHPKNYVRYNLDLPENPELHFGIGMDSSVWTPEKGDGVGFNVYVSTTDQPGIWHHVFYQYLDPKNNPDDRHWKDFSVDLARFYGQKVEIIFETDPGPNENSNFDWAAWSEPLLITGVGNN